MESVGSDGKADGSADSLVGTNSTATSLGSVNDYSCYLPAHAGTRELAQQLRTLAFPKDRSSVPRTHVRQVAPACNGSSSDLKPPASVTCTPAHLPCVDTHTKLIQINLKHSKNTLNICGSGHACHSCASPRHRGSRLSCSMARIRTHRHSARSWLGDFVTFVSFEGVLTCKDFGECGQSVSL